MKKYNKLNSYNNSENIIIPKEYNNKKLKICILDEPIENHIAYNKHDTIYPRKPCKLLKLLDYEYEYYMVDFNNPNLFDDIHKHAKYYDCFLILYDTGVNFIKLLEFLEINNYSHTGTSSFYSDLSRERLKQICNQYNILTPKHAFIYNTNNLDQQLDYVESYLNYPLFVKNIRSTDSIGIDSGSKCLNRNSLYNQIIKIMNEYPNGCMIEEFINGSEYTSLVIGNKFIDYDVYKPYYCHLESINYKTFAYKNKHHDKTLKKEVIILDEICNEI